VLSVPGVASPLNGRGLPFSTLSQLDPAADGRARLHAGDRLLQIARPECVEQMERLGIDKVTNKVFVNRQRTSAHNGILKSEACWRFGKVLVAHGVNYLQDVPALVSDARFAVEREP
jgi:hypothetical protein